DTVPIDNRARSCGGRTSGAALRCTGLSSVLVYGADRGTVSRSREEDAHVKRRRSGYSCHFHPAIGATFDVVRPSKTGAADIILPARSKVELCAELHVPRPLNPRRAQPEGPVIRVDGIDPGKIQRIKNVQAA